MKITLGLNWRSWKMLPALPFLAIGIIPLPPANAAIVNITDGGSTFIVDTDSSAGMYHWDVGSANQLNQQWFWYRVGTGLAQPINNISLSAVSTPLPNLLVTTYANAQLSLSVSYLLNGGGVGSGNADIIETISIKNLSGSPLDFHLFQYSDFNLLGTALGDSASSGAPSPIIQWEGGSALTETTTLPPADRWEIGVYDTTRNSLNTVAGYDLANTPGVVNGDVTWAFQWDRIIGTSPSDDEITITKDKGLRLEAVPEPSALALLTFGVTALAMLRKSRAGR